MILTGGTAALFFEAQRIGKCRNLSVEVTRTALPTTRRGDWDETFVAAIRSTSMTGTLLYDPEDAATVSLLDAVYEDNEDAAAVTGYFDFFGGKKIEASAIITSVGISVAFGEAQACAIGLQVSGKPTTVF